MATVSEYALGAARDALRNLEEALDDISCDDDDGCDGECSYAEEAQAFARVLKEIMEYLDDDRDEERAHQIRRLLREHGYDY